MSDMFGEQIITKATITRPSNTTDYTAGDVISNSTSATTLMPFNANFNAGGSGYITKIILKTNNPLFLTQIRLWLYKDSAYSVAVDNAANQITYAGKEIGYIDMPVLQAVGTACAMSEWTGTFAYSNDPATNMIYGSLEIKTGVMTPVSGQQFSVEVTLERN